MFSNHGCVVIFSCIIRHNKPPSQVNLSGWRLILSWQPHILPVEVGKQKVLHNPFLSEQLGFT